MGDIKAREIAQLWGAFFGTLGTSNDMAAAFQLAIWKIEYDWGSANLNNFAAGNFRAAAYSGNTTPITQATTWLNL